MPGSRAFALYSVLRRHAGAGLARPAIAPGSWQPVRSASTHTAHNAEHRLRGIPHVPTVTSGSPFPLDRPLKFLTEEPQIVPGSRATELMAALRSDGQRIVEVERGVYSDLSTDPSAFEKHSIPLQMYLEWLERTPDGQLDGKQLYLAQSEVRVSVVLA